MTPLNQEFSLKDSGYSNTQHAIDLPRHRWYFIKEAFAPQIVEKAIEDANCQEGDIIIDPFAGSGTVPLTASLKGYPGVGFEVNPFLAFMSNTKLLQTEPELFEEKYEIVVDKIRQGKKSALETFSTFSEGGSTKKWLFNQDILRAFEGGWEATHTMPGSVRDLLRLGLLGATMDNCNASRDGKCLRYLKGWQRRQFNGDDFLTAFEERITNIKEDLKICPNPDKQSRIFSGDSRRLLASEMKNKFKLCVTSPPYLNSFDYTDVYRPELFLGKFVRTQEQLRLLRLETIRSHVQASWPKPTKNSFGPLYRESIEKVKQRSEALWDRRIPSMIQAYFEDIAQVLRKLRNLAKSEASVWLIVSTSAYAGVEIPVDLIIAHIGSKVGWFLREVGVLRYLRSSGQHWPNTEEEKPRLRESVIIFDASSKRGR